MKIGIWSSFTGFTAYMPVNTPVLSRFSWRSMSVLAAALAR